MFKGQEINQIDLNRAAVCVCYQARTEFTVLWNTDDQWCLYSPANHHQTSGGKTSTWTLSRNTERERKLSFTGFYQHWTFTGDCTFHANVKVMHIILYVKKEAYRNSSLLIIAHIVCKHQLQVLLCLLLINYVIIQIHTYEWLCSSDCKRTMDWYRPLKVV